MTTATTTLTGQKNTLEAKQRSFMEKLEVSIGRQPKVRTVSSFEELCPEWSKRLNRGEISLIEKSAIQNIDSCVLGEAWGGSGVYAFGFIRVLGCHSCSSLGSKFTAAIVKKKVVPSALRELELEFVKHWNAKHGGQ